MLLLALALRVWALDFGLPHRFHPDEAFEVFRALQLGAGEFDFSRVLKGGYYFLLFALYAAYFAVLLATGQVSGPQEFGLHFATDPTPFWLLGRLLTAALGTATVALVYAIGRRIAGLAAGVWGAAALAVTLLHVEDSHYITVDVPQGFFVALTFLLLLRYADEGRPRNLFVGMLLAAVATAFKGPAAVLGLPWALAVLHRARLEPDRRRVLRQGLLAGLAAVLLYVALAPGILMRVGLVEFESARVGTSRTASEAVFVQLGGQHRVEGWRLYPSFLWHDFGAGWGAPLLLLYGAAVVAAALRHRRADVLFLAFLLPTLAGFLFVAPLAAGRYLIPALVLTAPFVGVIAASALSAARARGGPASGLVAAGLLLALGLSAVGAARWNRWLAGTDTREMALSWMLRNVPPDSPVLLSGNISFPETGTVPLPISADYLREQARTYRALGQENKARYLEEFQIPAARQPGYEPVYVAGRDALSLEEYLAGGVGTFVVDESLLRRARSRSGREAFPELDTLIADLSAGEGVDLAASFAPSFPDTPGPRLWIYRAEPARLPEPAPGRPIPAAPEPEAARP